MRILAFTMVYNESENIRCWSDYYQSQLGLDSTLIVDNASDDESVPFIRSQRNLLYPKMVFSNNLRSSFISQLASSFLLLYDLVIYTDVDEMIVSNPEKYKSLRHYFETNTSSAFTCLGFDLVHILNEDADLRDEENLLSQRRHIRPIRSMCKTLATRRPIRWGGGFHTSDARPFVDPDLWLFHTKSADLSRRLRRQAITRTVVRDDNSGGHQRWDDDTVTSNFRRISLEPRLEFSQDIANNLSYCLQSSFERKYYENSDILKYQIKPEFEFERRVYRLADRFPSLF